MAFHVTSIVRSTEEAARTQRTFYVVSGVNSSVVLEVRQVVSLILAISTHVDFSPSTRRPPFRRCSDGTHTAATGAIVHFIPTK